MQEKRKKASLLVCNPCGLIVMRGANGKPECFLKSIHNNRRKAKKYMMILLQKVVLNICKYNMQYKYFYIETVYRYIGIIIA